MNRGQAMENPAIVSGRWALIVSKSGHDTSRWGAFLQFAQGPSFTTAVSIGPVTGANDAGESE